MVDDLRMLQIERDAFLIAALPAHMYLFSHEERGSERYDRHESACKPLRTLLDSARLGSLVKFNETAWLGTKGILAQYIASPVRGHRCGAGPIEALVWGCAGRLACTLYREDECVALLGEDSEGRPIGFAQVVGTVNPTRAADLLWQAADLGAELAASMRRDDGVAHPAVLAWRSEQRQA